MGASHCPGNACAIERRGAAVHELYCGRTRAACQLVGREKIATKKVINFTCKLNCLQLALPSLLIKNISFRKRKRKLTWKQYNCTLSRYHGLLLCTSCISELCTPFHVHPVRLWYHRSYWNVLLQISGRTQELARKYLSLSRSNCVQPAPVVSGSQPLLTKEAISLCIRRFDTTSERATPPMCQESNRVTSHHLKTAPISLLSPQ